MKERGGKVAQSSSNCFNESSLTHVKPTRLVNVWNSRLHTSVQNRSSVDAPKTTTIFVVAGHNWRMSSTIPGRFTF